MATTIIHRKEKIIYTAIEVINESGLHAFSTKKVAQMEGIAESTIFKHFKSKNGILSAVLDFYCQYDDDIIESIQTKELMGTQALKFFLDSYLRYYENYSAITAITQGLYEIRHIDELADKVVKIINKRNDCLIRIIEEAQQKKEITNQHGAVSFVDAITGAINGIIRRWRMEKMAFNLYQRCQDAITLIVGENYPLEEVNNSGR